MDENEKLWVAEIIRKMWVSQDPDTDPYGKRLSLLTMCKLLAPQDVKEIYALVRKELP